MIPGMPTERMHRDLLYSDRKHLSPRIRTFIDFFQGKWREHPWDVIYE